MISKFGLYIREIRKKSNDSLRLMAKKLDVSAPFLSAVEMGRKAISLEYVDKISEIYNLSKEEKEKLEDAINETNNRVSIELEKMNEGQKEVSLMFSRKIKNADPELIEKLRKVLYDDKD